MVRHFLILENSETEFSVDPRNGRRNNTTRSSLVGDNPGYGAQSLVMDLANLIRKCILKPRVWSISSPAFPLPKNKDLIMVGSHYPLQV